MGHWNYRIMAKEHNGEFYLGVYEVYYDDDGTPNGCSMNPITIGSETKKGICWIVNRIKDATKKPILFYGDRFPEEYKV